MPYSAVMSMTARLDEVEFIYWLSKVNLVEYFGSRNIRRCSGRESYQRRVQDLEEEHSIFV